MKFLKIIFFFSLIIAFCFAQSDQEKLRIVGKSLRGMQVNGEPVREVSGDVIIYHGEVKITCDRALQFLDQNNVELIGNVIVTKDTVSIFTSHGYYNGNTKVAFSRSGIVLNDGKNILTAVEGFYFSEADRAEFQQDVVMFDTKSKLISRKLEYFNEIDKSIATGNVKLTDTSTVLYADSLINFKKDNISYAYNNIRILNRDNNLSVFGNYLENYGEKKYARVLKDPVLMQVDTSESGIVDTLIMSALEMEMFNDSTAVLVAKDSVKIVRGGFSSANNKTTYFKNTGRIRTIKGEADERQPVLWFEETQLLGDSVDIYLDDNKLNYINIRNESFVISENENFDFRYNQISGDSLRLYFSDNKLIRTEVDGHVLSIYYMFEEGKANGLIKSSSERAKVFFEDNNIDDVRFYISVENEYHPEPLVTGNEKDFTLPLFKIFNDRPDKNNILFKLK